MTIDPEDIRFDRYWAAGATWLSATHIPTGIFVEARKSESKASLLKRLQELVEGSAEAKRRVVAMI